MQRLEIEARSEKKKDLLKALEEWRLELTLREKTYHLTQNGMDIIPISKGYKLKWQREHYKSFMQSKQECVEKLDQIQNQLTALDNEATVRQIVDPPNTFQVNSNEHSVDQNLSPVLSDNPPNDDLEAVSPAVLNDSVDQNLSPVLLDNSPHDDLEVVSPAILNGLNQNQIQQVNNLPNPVSNEYVEVLFNLIEPLPQLPQRKEKH